MSNDHDHLSNIEAYLLRRMGEEERRAFERQLANDPALREETAAHRQIFGGFQVLREEQFAADVRAWVSETSLSETATAQYTKIVPIARGRRRLYWLAAAAIFIALLGSFVFRQFSSSYTNESLAVSAYTAPVSENTMGEAPTAASTFIAEFEAAHQLFQAKKYPEAAAAFQQFQQSLQSDTVSLDPLTRNYYLENARWTELLAAFAAGQLSQKEFLERLEPFSMGDYAGKVEMLRRDVKVFWREWAE